MTKPLFVLGTFCCFVLGGCVATVQKSKIVDKAPEVESQYIPDIPSLPGVGGVNTPAALPPSSR